MSSVLEIQRVFGIHCENSLVGFLDILFGYPDSSTCMIGYLVIDQKYRNQGIGQDVYDQTKSYVAENNMKKIRLGVIENNQPVVRMGEKQGFEVMDRVETEYGPK